MWIVCITSVRHVLTVNGYGGRQTKENEKSWCFKGWETLVKKEARIYAEQNLNWKDRYMQVCEILKNATIAPYKEDLVDQIKCFEHRKTGKFNVLPYAFYYWKKLKG